MTRKRPSRSDLHQSRKRHRPRKRKSSGLRTFFAILLIFIGVGLLALDPLKNKFIEQGTQQNTVGNLTREQIESNKQADVTYNFDDIEQLDTVGVLRDRVQGNADASDLPVIGGIAIPDVGMNLPIHKGVSNAGMYLGAGTLDPNQKMGESNYPLASHHSIDKDLLFAPLLRVEMGSMIYLTDLDKVYQYEIDYIERVAPTRVDLLDPTDKPVVTLITCDYGLVDRFVVRGTLVDERPIQEASQEVLDAFEIPQTTAG
ncbi:class A sortase [Hutsoniella sourekii]|uniref:class A sortase n=1 Tax=Hutsoniella sourekii TaxID=87650 RepID=UPI0004851888|nr:class A sortase [Hutsoniella sourekii]